MVMLYLYWKATQLQPSRVVPDLITYTSVISVCGKGQQPDKASALLRRMQAHKLQPDRMTYGAYGTVVVVFVWVIIYLFVV